MPVQLIPVSEAQAGMITARDIKDPNGRILIQAGSRLNPIAIRRFPLWNINKIYIEADEINTENEQNSKISADNSLSDINHNPNLSKQLTNEIKNRFRGIPNNDFYKEYVLLITKHILENKGNGSIPGLD